MEEIAMAAIAECHCLVIREVARQAGGSEPSEEILVEAMDGRGLAHGLVALDPAAGVVAFLIWEMLGDNGYVNNLCVSPAFQNKRIGRRLLDRATAEMRDLGCSTTSLNVSGSKAALHLYTSMGYRPLPYNAGCLAKSLGQV